MIVIYQRNAAGSVERAATATTTAEAHDRLRTIHAPAVAFDGLLPVGASGHTRSTDLTAITEHATREAGGAVRDAASCVVGGCHRAQGRVNFKTPPHLAELCTLHRRRVCSCRGVDKDDPESVAAYIARAEVSHAR